MTTCIDPQAEHMEERRLLKKSRGFITRTKASITPGVYKNHEEKCPPTIDAFEESSVGSDLIDKHMRTIE